MDEFISRLKEQFDTDSERFFVSADMIVAQCAKMSLSFEDGCDQIGLSLAKQYYQKKLSYQFCDNVVNMIYSDYIDYVYDKPDVWASLFWDVYIAFDAGEISELDEDEDHVAKYTDPLIKELLENQNQLPTANKANSDA